MRTRAIPTTIAALALVCTLGAAGCTPQAAPPADERSGTEEPAGETPGDAFVSTALVIQAEGDQVLFVDQDTEAPYFPTLPEGAPELAPGNVVRVTGNGIMLESYPAQYPGITGVEVLEEGSPADAEKYQELVDQVWPARDPAEPPLASVEYRTELALVTLSTLRCGSTWSYGSGEARRTVAVDAAHPVQLEAADVPEGTVDGPTEATMTFDVPATAAGVVRWRSDELAAAAEAAGSAMAVDPDSVPKDALAADACKVADGAVTFTIEPGWRYAVDATFADGTATYVFAC